MPATEAQSVEPLSENEMLTFSSFSSSSNLPESSLAMNEKTRPWCDAGDMARECKCPSLLRETSRPNLHSLTIERSSSNL